MAGACGHRSSSRHQGAAGRGRVLGPHPAGLVGPLGCQGGVAAGDQAFGGVVGVGDLGEVGLVEQGHLQGPVIGGQGGDRGRA